jgi:hypothetical protein
MEGDERWFINVKNKKVEHVKSHEELEREMEEKREHREKHTK